MAPPGQSDPPRGAGACRPRSGAGSSHARPAPGRLDSEEAPLLETIVVAYDDPASRTLERAATLAELAGAALVVTNAVGPVASESADDAARNARDKLEQARRALGERELRADFVPSTGPPAEAIVRLAQERGADLIVVGTRHKGFLERLVEGSVLQEVLRRAKCDVLVVY